MNFTPSPVEIAATLCFALALLHTFAVKIFQQWASRFEEGSVGENFFHLLGEVEVVFGLWAAFFLLLLVFFEGKSAALGYLESRNFTEPAFVFVVLTICATRPVLHFSTTLIEAASRMLPLRRPVAFYAACLVLGPLLGSLITEPAAMAVTASILLERFYRPGISEKFRYATLGLLFVNISIGGVLTPYAAPPLLMVAQNWNWKLPYVLQSFGWKAALATLLSTAVVVFLNRKELASLPEHAPAQAPSALRIPAWIILLHLSFLAATVLASHHSIVFGGIFLFFLGLVSVTREFQSELKLREGLLVAFFLGGLVVLGGYQKWWLAPLLTRLDSLALFLGATSLTAITDNAALTYLGSQVPHLSEASRYALVAGAVTGGGLTVIANAPNPAGYGILNASFGREGISPLRLTQAALIPTLIAALCFWLLPSLGF
jgi:hypothetical protein